MIASIAPFTSNRTLSSIMLVAATTPNTSFLLTLLAAMLPYSEVGPRERLRKMMVYFFSMGMLSLLVTMIVF